MELGAQDFYYYDESSQPGVPDRELGFSRAAVKGASIGSKVGAVVGAAKGAMNTYKNGGGALKTVGSGIYHGVKGSFTGKVKGAGVGLVGYGVYKGAKYVKNKFDGTPQMIRR